MYEKVIKELIRTGVRNDWAQHASPVRSLQEIKARLTGMAFDGVGKLTVFGSFASGKNKD